MTKYRTMEDVRQANKARGHHFFDSSSLRFFDSHIGRELIHGRYFITSEQFHGSWEYDVRTGKSYRHDGPRLYTVRRVEDDGSISTVNDFQKFSSNAQARRYAEKLLDTSSPCANCRKPTYNRNFTCDECQHGTQE